MTSLTCVSCIHEKACDRAWNCANDRMPIFPCPHRKIAPCPSGWKVEIRETYTPKDKPALWHWMVSDDDMKNGLYGIAYSPEEAKTHLASLISALNAEVVIVPLAEGKEEGKR